MNMLEAYAHQVVSYHPVAQRDDLFAEIYDELCEEFSDQQAQTPDLSEVDFLNKYKQHPMRYATQLASDSATYLVGPQFYFSFLSAMKVALSVVVLFHLAVGVLGAFASGDIWSAFWKMLLNASHTMLWVGAAVIGVFIALERSGEKASWLDEWDAADLKPVNDHQSVSQLESSFDLGLSTFGLLFVLGIVDFPIVLNNGAEWIREWTINVPDGFWLAMGILFVLGMGFSLYCLSQTLWTSRMRIIAITKNILWIIMLALAVSHAELLSAGNQAAPAFLPILEKVVRGGLFILCLIIGWDTVVQIMRLARSRNQIWKFSKR